LQDVLSFWKEKRTTAGKTVDENSIDSEVLGRLRVKKKNWLSPTVKTKKRETDNLVKPEA